jgi:hypothetical protein
MNGGTISGNKTSDTAGHGGGVRVYGGTFYMLDGTISGNEAYLGGGVRASVGATFYMIGGTISNNEAKKSGAGGGVSYSSAGTYRNINGKITDNTPLQEVEESGQ